MLVPPMHVACRADCDSLKPSPALRPDLPQISLDGSHTSHQTINFSGKPRNLVPRILLLVFRGTVLLPLPGQPDAAIQCLEFLVNTAKFADQIPFLRHPGALGCAPGLASSRRGCSQHHPERRKPQGLEAPSVEVSLVDRHDGALGELRTALRLDPDSALGQMAWRWGDRSLRKQFPKQRSAAA